MDHQKEAWIISGPSLLCPESVVEIEKNCKCKLNIVIQVVGSRGDVQPFIAFGNELQRWTPCVTSYAQCVRKLRQKVRVGILHSTHCVQASSIPVHLMFTMPWSSTESFPHSLASMSGGNADESLKNYVPYGVVDWLTWQVSLCFLLSSREFFDIVGLQY
ncbi:hypothetical protein TSTA_097510 [Talaromyces stipitatus ATCC 10500]|uniref:Glycosyltransferase family 28 N-terminal domain-containing protein n=1 Tax=Talaromyces stipitatus (strain ATCC 10500 / CBS 375.48 / QM 6759 / NRRL 1006) TaxID=441959 RepID=B8MLY3_TALSN|nr:uncharacterized protein TSTA_097510 [Talaromyces stipitatus ATCC 10500]EED13495.1 hypothetical protein TSTA_097510 [Talaromyces stipitatus ATCC 10500]